MIYFLIHISNTFSLHRNVSFMMFILVAISVFRLTISEFFPAVNLTRSDHLLVRFFVELGTFYYLRFQPIKKKSVYSRRLNRYMETSKWRISIEFSLFATTWNTGNIDFKSLSLFFFQTNIIYHLAGFWIMVRRALHPNIEWKTAA